MSEWYQLDADEAVEELGSDSSKGLTTGEAEQRLQRYGYNELIEKGVKNPWRILWEQLTAVMVLILIVAAVVSFALGEYDDAIGVNVSHTFAEQGIFTIGLIVTDTGGLTDTATAEVTVSNLAPSADAGGPYTGDEGSVINFDASGSSDPGGGALTYAWDLDNDGEYDDDIGVAASYTWTEQVNLTISLMVTDTGGLTDTATAQVVVNDSDPIADFVAAPTSGDEPLTVVFTDTSVSYDGIITWSWDLDGDDSPDATIPNPTFEYTATGAYTVTLTVWEGDGDSDTETKVGYIITGDVGPRKTYLPLVVRGG